MTSPQAPTDLESRAMDFWESGRLDEAERLYSELLTGSHPDHVRYPDYLSQRASVRAKLGRHDQARADFELAVECELKQGKSDASSPVAVARYFLGEHALEMGDAQRAGSSVAPSLGKSTTLEGLLQMVHALAMSGLGRESEARAAATAAMAAASTKQRPKFTARLAALMTLPGYGGPEE